jgi:hypothetical protein
MDRPDGFAADLPKSGRLLVTIVATINYTTSQQKGAGHGCLEVQELRIFEGRSL